MYNENTRIIDLTVGELTELIHREMAIGQQQMVEILPSKLNEIQASKPHEPQGILYGLDGICKALGCGKSKAMMLKKMGALEGGYQQIGKSIIIKDAQMLRNIAEAFDKRTKRTRTN